MDCEGLKYIDMYLDCDHNFMGLYIFQNALYSLHRCSNVHKLYFKIAIKKENGKHSIRRLVMSYFLQPHGLQPPRHLCP